MGAAVGVVALGGAGIGAWAATAGAPSPAPHGGIADAGSGSPAPGTTSGSGTGAGSSATGAVTPSIVVVPPTTTTSGVPQPAPPTTSTSVVQAPPGTLVLTQSSAGGSYDIAPGQVVQVVLPGTGQPYHGFSTPQPDNGAVSPDGKSCSAPSGQFCTEFVGSAAGTARLTSTSEPACRQSTPPCEIASQVWWVSLTVG